MRADDPRGTIEYRMKSGEYILSARAVRAAVADRGPSLTVYDDGTYVARDAQGAETLRIDAPPPEQRHTLNFGACDCCDRLPAGTVAEVLALLPDDHPAARKLREATGGLSTRPTSCRQDATRAELVGWRDLVPAGRIGCRARRDPCDELGRPSVHVGRRTICGRCALSGVGSPPRS